MSVDMGPVPVSEGWISHRETGRDREKQNSVTGQFLNGSISIEIPSVRRELKIS
jgi:excinuclease UvrABC ATPase subunit